MMRKIIISVFIILIGSVYCNAQVFGPNHHIVCYFTRPVDNSYARTEKAISLIRTAGDTVISYINRAKYTLDIAMYDFVEDSTWFEQGNIPDIAGAINKAYARGVKIRWICNQLDTVYSPNTGLDSINKAIYVLPSPSGGSYGIMHNKFMVIDGRSTNPNDAIVWTGCMNWEPGQIDKDANNLVIIQDSAFAHCYLMEFNQMWGDTVEGGKYNLVDSKFGPYKKDITPHNFIIDGHKVESYFSPSDTTNNHIISTMATAQKEIDFGVFEFSYVTDANEIISMKNKGIYVAGVMDQYSLSYTPYGALSSAMGSMLQVYFGNDSLFHNKYVIVDPCDMQADPMVLTGSHNWTTEAEVYNDENTIIIHDSTVANLFYQAFIKTYTDLAQSPLVQQCVPLTINELNPDKSLSTYPNPAGKQLTVTINIPDKNISYKIYNIMGQQVLEGTLDKVITNKIDVSSVSPGIYMLIIKNGNKQYTEKFDKE
ncbi:MAG TPA: phospholipase D-like domain-containing protein [Bacteroidia bacterium]|jgi:phosphatidylserine/phosphatidylglycerophosphate/cardiolipin synthase-like enzyme|nr:phospholipase D-like domain-containing protein [Bacteroidia bacterium]